MNNELKTPVLFKPIQELAVSEDFKVMASENGFETLDEILSLHLSSLLQKEKFSLHVMEELYKLIEREELVKLLKTE
jgi:hypothetical protein